MHVLPLKTSPLRDGAIVVPAPAYARFIHRFGDYVRELPLRSLFQEGLDGLRLRS